ncbi:ABC transporter substrate-binding protein [Chloroflexus sp.]|uniref:ABC transporter substrate-binding protein n=1 Tax=Chloroflexus sp. TaxID=1904827 RepID=UPI00298F0221|nr:ABC transporter substrate-binding protein [Chloroflexus sp.]MCS6888829.1 ABC transporter substrate-binding protein [Chloroflexus sp.]MDW8402967.1 ABC transporter substrate-binding protein [Chloroflexus sp.]
MRVVSLVPPATEIICRLGLADLLVGVSHLCDFPAEVVASLPRVTRSAIPTDLLATELDWVLSTRLRRGDSLFTLDEAALISLAPDLIITQDLCDPGVASFDDVCVLAKRLPGNSQIVSLTMPDCDDTDYDVMTIAEAIGYPERGRRLRDQIRTRLARVQMTIAGRPRPKVVTLEWLDPPYTAGRLAAEIVRMAGGNELLSRADGHSVPVSWQQIHAVQPDVIVLLLAGHSAQAAERCWKTCQLPREWRAIPAIREQRVYTLDARPLSLRPSARMVDRIEQMAYLLHPTCFKEQCHA